MKKIFIIFIPFLIIFGSGGKDESPTSSNDGSNSKTVRLVATINKTGTSMPTIIYSNESGGSSQLQSKTLDKSFKANSGANISLSAYCTAEVPRNGYGQVIGDAYGSISLKIYIDGSLKANGQDVKTASSSVNVSASCSAIVP